MADLDRWHYANLWNGLDKVVKHTEDGIHELKEIVEFFKKRVSLEEEYASKLNNLCQSSGGLVTRFIKTFGSNEVAEPFGTLGTSWKSVQKYTEGIAAAHLAFSKSLATDVLAPLTAFQNEKEKQRKTIVSEGQSHTKKYHDALSNLSKAKTNFEKAAKEYHSTENQYYQAKQESKDQKAVTKLEGKSKQLKEKADQCDVKYQTELRHANEVQREYYSKQLPAVLTQFQTLEHARVAELKKGMESCVRLLFDVVLGYQDNTTKMDKAVSTVDVEGDIEKFVKENTPENSPPSDIQYENPLRHAHKEAADEGVKPETAISAVVDSLPTVAAATTTTTTAATTTVTPTTVDPAPSTTNSVPPTSESSITSSTVSIDLNTSLNMSAEQPQEAPKSLSESLPKDDGKQDDDMVSLSL